ncbi:hypothetical protein SUDANB145_06334 [Streptomyces sp. enrichment culture]
MFLSVRARMVRGNGGRTSLRDLAQPRKLSRTWRWMRLALALLHHHPTAMERFPALGLLRLPLPPTATRDIELGGKQIKKAHRAVM